MMSINTEEVNFLLYRYLEEAGFHHSAYVFGQESSVITAGIDGTLIPRGALLSLLQKSVFFTEAEVFALLTDSEIDSKFEKAVGSMSLLECTTTDAAKLKAMERAKDLSRVCSPHPSTSSSVTTTNSATATSTCAMTISPTRLSSAASGKASAGMLEVTPLGEARANSSTPMDTTGPSIVSGQLPTSLTTPTRQNSASNNNGALPTENYNNTSTPLYHGVATSSTAGQATVTVSTYAGNNSRSTQIQREREFRAQQSPQLQSGAGGGAPRGAYRQTTTSDHKNSNTNLSNNDNTVTSQAYYQHRQQSAGNEMASSVDVSTPMQFLNATNGLAFTTPLLQQHQQQNLNIKTEINTDFLNSTPTKQLPAAATAAPPPPPPPSSVHQQPQQQTRYLLNGNHTIRKSPAATGTVAASTTATNSVKSSVLTAPTSGAIYHQYFKENP